MHSPRVGVVMGAARSSGIPSPALLAARTLIEHSRFRLTLGLKHFRISASPTESLTGLANRDAAFFNLREEEFDDIRFLFAGPQGWARQWKAFVAAAEDNCLALRVGFDHFDFVPSYCISAAWSYSYRAIRVEFDGTAR